MKYEIVTHDGKTYEIQQDNPEIVARLAGKLDLIPVTLSSGKIEYFSKGTVARIQSSSKQSKAPRIEAKPPMDNRGTVSEERFKELRRKFRTK